jgi:dienelactone hydrolase
MGTAILLMLVAVEAAFLVWNLAKRDTHKQAKAVSGIALAALFAVATIAGAVQWSFRYYGIATVLALVALLGAIRLVRRHGTDYKAAKCVGVFFAKSAAFAAALLPAIVLPQYDLVPQSGTLSVQTATFSFTDPVRIETYDDGGEHRYVNVQCWYPGDDGKYPLLVFSHGLVGVKFTNESMFRNLASNGYVSCSIDHTYHAAFTSGPNGVAIVSPDFLDQYDAVANDTAAGYDYEAAAKVFAEWMEVRTGDMNLVIDSILARAVEPGSTAPYNLVDPERIAVGGHSLGAATALEVGRQRTDVSAVIALDGSALGEIESATPDSFVFDPVTYPHPVLSVYSQDTWDALHSQNPGSSGQNLAWIQLPAPDMYNVVVLGTSHLQLTDLALFSPLLAGALDSSTGGLGSRDQHETLSILNELSASFLNAYVKGEGSFSSATER